MPHRLSNGPLAMISMRMRVGSGRQLPSALLSCTPGDAACESKVRAARSVRSGQARARVAILVRRNARRVAILRRERNSIAIDCSADR
jgi:hypothetical protein